MPNLYIIAGCNGAGKTTASYTILPEILDCTDFVNADEIARGLSPFRPETVSFQAGRIMLTRIQELIDRKNNFAFETTLSTRSYLPLIRQAKKAGYMVTLLFFWLESVELARERVRIRVEMGGHDIPRETIERRYYRGLRNFFQLYIRSVDEWMVFDNSGKDPDLIAAGGSGSKIIANKSRWLLMKS